MSAGKLSCWSCTGLGASSREERPASEKEGERGGGGARSDWQAAAAAAH